LRSHKLAIVNPQIVQRARASAGRQMINAIYRGLDPEQVMIEPAGRGFRA
jgi:hypothetical protein